MASEKTSVESLTKLLRDARDGDSSASNQAYSLIYQQLQSVARQHLRRCPPGSATLTPTALVHETWLKLVAARYEIRDREHYLAIASCAMRQIVIDAARARLCDKRGGDTVCITFVDDVGHEREDSDVLQLEAALQRLEQVEPRLGQVVQYRFFAGLSEEEIATLLGVTDRTVRRDWRKARAFLHAELRGVSS